MVNIQSTEQIIDHKHASHFHMAAPFQHLNTKLLDNSRKYIVCTTGSRSTILTPKK